MYHYEIKAVLTTNGERHAQTFNVHAENVLEAVRLVYVGSVINGDEFTEIEHLKLLED